MPWCRSLCDLELQGEQSNVKGAAVPALPAHCLSAQHSLKRQMEAQGMDLTAESEDASSCMLVQEGFSEEEGFIEMN